MLRMDRRFPVYICMVLSYYNINCDKFTNIAQNIYIGIKIKLNIRLKVYRHFWRTTAPKERLWNVVDITKSKQLRNTRRLWVMRSLFDQMIRILALHIYIEFQPLSVVVSPNTKSYMVPIGIEEWLSLLWNQIERWGFLANRIRKAFRVSSHCVNAISRKPYRRLLKLPNPKCWILQITAIR